jgi:flagellar protein FliS
MELNSTLDHKAAPEIAGQLSSLYEFCTSQLLKANMDNDVKALDNVIQILNTLYDGWVAAVDEVRKQKAISPGGK